MTALAPAMSGVTAPFAGRRIAFATMHEKERAVASVRHAHLDADLVVPAGVDTDALGTFTSETPRQWPRARWSEHHSGSRLASACITAPRNFENRT